MRPTEVGKVLGKAWWAGFMVLLVSLVMMVVCTVFDLDMCPWKDILHISLGYVVGIPIGASTAR